MWSFVVSIRLLRLCTHSISVNASGLIRDIWSPRYKCDTRAIKRTIALVNWICDYSNAGEAFDIASVNANVHYLGYLPNQYIQPLSQISLTSSQKIASVIFVIVIIYICVIYVFIYAQESDIKQPFLCTEGTIQWVANVDNTVSHLECIY